jgi:hypothetical protein
MEQEYIDEGSGNEDEMKDFVKKDEDANERRFFGPIKQRSVFTPRRFE